MSVQKNLKLVTLSTLLLVFAACSDKKSSKSNNQSAAAPTPQVSAVCEGIQCLSSINWRILLQGQVFPDKTRMDINGHTVLDECMGKQQNRIDRSSAPQSIFLENYTVPKPGKVRISIYDQGWDCSHETTFLLNQDTQFEVTKGQFGSEILINL